MRLAKIRKMDISNGPGIRVSIFTQGCNKHCLDCFNPDTWDLKLGFEFTPDVQTQILNLMNEHIAGLSILGGEPLLEQNLPELVSFLNYFKTLYPEKTIWLWTGYTMEELTDAQKKVLSFCDAVIDGPFERDKKDLNLYYAGSYNQRLWVKTEEGLVQVKMPRKK